VTVEVLAWRVKSKYDETKTLAMVKGGTYAIVMVVEGNDYVAHKSREFNDSLEAEDWLRDVTADGDLVYGPEAFYAESPPEPTKTTAKIKPQTGAMILDAPFRSWAENVVLSVVDRNLMYRRLAAATFTFGEPEPAFSR